MYNLEPQTRHKALHPSIVFVGVSIIISLGCVVGLIVFFVGQSSGKAIKQPTAMPTRTRLTVLVAQSAVKKETRLDTDQLIAVAVSATVQALLTSQKSMVANTSTVTPTLIVLPTVAPATETPIPTKVSEPTIATVASDANLRAGPGTDYTIAGGLLAGTTLTLVARNVAGDWYQLADGKWISAKLVSNAPQVLSLIEAPSPTPPIEPTQASPNRALVGTVKVDHWRFDINKVQLDPGIDAGRQSIILLGYLTNEGTKTDTFTALYTLLLQDSHARQYDEEDTVTWAAQEKYGAAIAASINPEARKYIAIGFDVPATEKSFTLVPGSLAANWSSNVTFTVP